MNNQKLKILVIGAYGRMGKEAVNAIQQDSQLELVGGIGRGDNLISALEQLLPDCAVDLTVPQAVYSNCKTIIEKNVHPVVGTSGLNPLQLAELKELCQEKKLGGIIAPNFSLGAVLMIKLAAQAARYFPDMEIIEMHHNKKQDAPSGTAIKTAETLAKSLVDQPKTSTLCQNGWPETLGTNVQNIPIHSVRLPGLVAHQQIIFGGHSESLTIKHDSFNRQCFMPGIILSCKKAPTLTELIYGLENII